MGPRRTGSQFNYNNGPHGRGPAGGVMGTGPAGGMNNNNGHHEQRRTFPYPSAEDRRRDPPGNRNTSQYSHSYRPQAPNMPAPAFGNPGGEWQNPQRVDMGQRRDMDNRGARDEDHGYRGRREREPQRPMPSYQDQNRGGGFNSGRGNFGNNAGNGGFNNFNSGPPNPRDMGSWKQNSQSGPSHQPPPQQMYYSGAQYPPFPNQQPGFNNPSLPTNSNFIPPPHPMPHMQNNAQAAFMGHNRGWGDASNVPPRPPQFPVPPMISNIPQQQPRPPGNWHGGGNHTARQYTDGRSAGYYGGSNNSDGGAYRNDGNSFNNFGNNQANAYASSGFQNHRDQPRDNRDLSSRGRQGEQWQGAPSRGWPTAVEQPYMGNKAAFSPGQQAFQTFTPPIQQPLPGRPHQLNFPHTPQNVQAYQPFTTASNPQNTQMPPRRSHAAASPLPVPHPTKEYLDASLEPLSSAAEPPRMLVILDLNGALLFRNKNSSRMSTHPTLRPHLSGFLDYLFKNFDVMVWSSAQPQNVKTMVQAAFSKEQRDKLLALWGRDMLGLTQKQVYMKVVVYKNLDRVWKANLKPPVPKTDGAEGEKGVKEETATDGKEVSTEAQTGAAEASAPEVIYSQANTILIDDSVVKATSQPYNHVLITEYTDPRTQANDVALLEVIGYLEEIRRGKYTNVSAFIRGRPFRPGSQKEKWLEDGKAVIQQMGYDIVDSGVIVPLPDGNRRQRRTITNEQRKKERKEKKAAKAAAKRALSASEAALEGLEGGEGSSSDSDASSHTAEPVSVAENVPRQVPSPNKTSRKNSPTPATDGLPQGNSGNVRKPSPARPAAVPAVTSTAADDEDILVWSEDESGDENGHR